MTSGSKTASYFSLLVGNIRSILKRIQKLRDAQQWCPHCIFPWAPSLPHYHHSPSLASMVPPSPEPPPNTNFLRHGFSLDIFFTVQPSFHASTSAPPGSRAQCLHTPLMLTTQSSTQQSPPWLNRSSSPQGWGAHICYPTISPTTNNDSMSSHGIPLTTDKPQTTKL